MLTGKRQNAKVLSVVGAQALTPRSVERGRCAATVDVGAGRLLRRAGGRRMERRRLESLHHGNSRRDSSAGQPKRLFAGEGPRHVRGTTSRAASLQAAPIFLLTAAVAGGTLQARRGRRRPPQDGSKLGLS